MVENWLNDPTATCKCKVLNPTRHESVRKDVFVASPYEKSFLFIRGIFYFMITKEESEEVMSKGSFFGFIPHRLTNETKLELWNFPFNIMFMKVKVENGKRISGTSLYEPNLTTYKEKNCEQSMFYRNIYGGDGLVKIIYFPQTGKRIGEKYVNGEKVRVTYGGPDWNNFFTSLTVMGLNNGEQCEFKDIDFGQTKVDVLNSAVKNKEDL